MELPWNYFLHCIHLQGYIGSKSGVRLPPFSPNHLRVSPGCRRSLGRDHPWSYTITGSCITSPFNGHGTAFLHTSAFKAASTIGSGFRPPIFSPGYFRVMYECRGSPGVANNNQNSPEGRSQLPSWLPSKTASLMPLNASWYWIVESDHLSVFLWFSLCFRM